MYLPFSLQPCWKSMKVPQFQDGRASGNNRISNTLLDAGMTSASSQLRRNLAFWGNFQWHGTDGRMRQPIPHSESFLRKFFLSYWAETCLAVALHAAVQGFVPKTYYTKLEFHVATGLPWKLQISYFWATFRKPELEKPGRWRANSHLSTACLLGFIIKGTESSLAIFRNSVCQHLTGQRYS